MICAALFVNTAVIPMNKDQIIAEKNQKIEEYLTRIDSTQTVNEQLKNRILDILSKGIKVTVTNYNPVRQQTDDTPNILADQSKIDVHSASKYQYVAISRNLHERWGGFLKFGDLILIKNAEGKDGIYCVRDVMNERFVNAIDILETMGTENYKYYGVDLYKLSWIVLS